MSPYARSKLEDVRRPGWLGITVALQDLTVRLDDDLAADPEVLARARGQSLNETVKTALREADERRRDPKFATRVRCIIDEIRELLERLAK
jgi:predicted transcriptional regulator